MNRPLEERLAEKSVPVPSGCIEWGGYRDPLGYGRLHFGGKPRLTHKLAWELQYGPVADGFELDHTCTNPPCMNLAHLEPVTHAENLRRGRATRPPTFSDEVLAEIRRTYRRYSRDANCKTLAQRFGVSPTTIWYVVKEGQA